MIHVLFFNQKSQEKLVGEKVDIKEFVKNEKHKYIKDKLNNKKVKEIEKYFKQKSLQERKGLTVKKRSGLKIEGNGLVSISREYGIKGNPISHQDVWYDLLEAIFQEKIN